MRYVYLSHVLAQDTPLYGGEGTILVESLRSMTLGDTCNAGRWSLPNHAGTHIDLPRHFVQDGKCVDDYPPEFWIFTKVGVIEITDIQPAFVISPELLDHYDGAQDIELILLKTGFGRWRTTDTYWQAGPVFCPALADYLRDRFPLLRVLGIDSISISSWADRMTGREAHRTFLTGERPILLVEDMDLEPIGVKNVLSSVTVTPLRVRGADASPCTVVAEVLE